MEEQHTPRRTTEDELTPLRLESRVNGKPLGTIKSYLPGDSLGQLGATYAKSLEDVADLLACPLHQVQTDLRDFECLLRSLSKIEGTKL